MFSSSGLLKLNNFVYSWHHRTADNEQSRLLIWKANAFKGQVLCEMFLYSILTAFILSLNYISSYIFLRRILCFIVLYSCHNSFLCILFSASSYPYLLSYVGYDHVDSNLVLFSSTCRIARVHVFTLVPKILETKLWRRGS